MPMTGCLLLPMSGCLRLPLTPDRYSEPLRPSLATTLTTPWNGQGGEEAAAPISSVQRKAAVLRSLAQTEAAAKRYPLACALLLQASQVDPADPQLHLDRADCLLHLGRAENARAPTLQALALLGSGGARPMADAPPTALKQAYATLYATRRFVDLPRDGTCAPLTPEASCGRPLTACSIRYGGDAGASRSTVKIAVGPPPVQRWLRTETPWAAPWAAPIDGYLQAAAEAQSSRTEAAPVELPLSYERASGPVRCNVVYANGCTGLVGVVCRQRDVATGRTSFSVIEHTLAATAASQATAP